MLRVTEQGAGCPAPGWATLTLSQAITKENFRTSIFAAAIEANKEVKILHQLHQPADHPINIFHPEGEYLKGLVIQVFDK